jgi:hypothetical protein
VPVLAPATLLVSVFFVAAFLCSLIAAAYYNDKQEDMRELEAKTTYKLADDRIMAVLENDIDVRDIQGDFVNFNTYERFPLQTAINRFQLKEETRLLKDLHESRSKMILLDEFVPEHTIFDLPHHLRVRSRKEREKEFVKEANKGLPNPDELMGLAQKSKYPGSAACLSNTH